MTARLALIANPTSAANVIASMSLAVKTLDLIAGDPRAQLPRHDVLDREDVRGAAVHQLHPLAGQIAHRAVFPRQDRAGRQDPQSQQMGEVTRIRLVAAVLEPVVLFDRGGVGQMHAETGILEPIDQPIPVVGRLDHDAGQLALPAAEEADDLREIVRQSLLRNDPICFVDHRHNAVVRMQIYPAVLHLRLLWSKVSNLTLTPPRPRVPGRRLDDLQCTQLVRTRRCDRRLSSRYPHAAVMPGLVPGIHVIFSGAKRRGWPGQARP